MLLQPVNANKRFLLYQFKSNSKKNVASFLVPEYNEKACANPQVCACLFV